MVDDHLTTTFGFFDVLYVIRKVTMFVAAARKNKIK